MQNRVRMPTPHLDELDPITRHAFRIWIKANPEVWIAFVKACFDLWERGIRKYGAKTIWEHIRYEHDIKTTDERGHWKLNNDYAAYTARAVADYYPQFKDFFEFRAVTGLKRVKAEAA